MALTAAQLSESIAHLQLMSSRDLEAMRSRWFRPGRQEVENPAAFQQWLITNHFLTPFAARLLSLGKGDLLVLNQYRVRDQIKAGPLAGAYLATDPLWRPVVLQILSRAVTDDPVRREQVEAIVRHAIALQHPNVCRVLDFGKAQGMTYLVREYDEATTLADILQRRNKLPYDQAAKIFALACEGLRALHEHQVPGGVLTADCILLAVAGKGPRPQRTVRLLVAAARQDLFDTGAIVPDADGIPDDAPLAALPEPKGALAVARPQDDILRLGSLFYRCLTGRDPFSAEEMPQPSRPAAPVGELAPEVPAELAQIVEGMIDPDPANRPKSAGHVAKAIRVFLRAEEESREVREEENVVIPQQPPAGRLAPPEESADGEEDVEEPEEEVQPRRARPHQPAAAAEGSLAKLWEVWDDIRPQQREWLYLAVGAALMILFILLLEFISGIKFVHVVLLATGAALSFLVERLLRWWEGRHGMAEEGKA